MRHGINILFGCALLALPVYSQDLVTTVAGQALVSGATNAVGTNALFSGPAALTVDMAGNIFVTDSENHIVRKIATNGLVSTFAGQPGVPGTANGLGTQARLNNPSGVTIDGGGNLFVSDTGNHTIRKITPAGAVTTIAGTAGQSGIADGTGLAAQFHSPLGLAIATNGTVYIADSGNHMIRTISGGVVATLAGLAETWGSVDAKGTNARFNGPLGLALSKTGDLFVSDSNNHTLRKIKPDGTVTTWAGLAGVDGCVNGERMAARFCKPAEIAFDRNGNLYVADSFNSVIRKIAADGTVTSVSGLAGSAGAVDGANGVARFFNPYGVALRPDGSLIASDNYNELVRLIIVPFQIKMLPVGNALKMLTWDTVAGRKYQVQSKSPALDAPWVNLGPPLLATNAVLSLSDNSTAATRLYRVLLVP